MKPLLALLVIVALLAVSVKGNSSCGNNTPTPTPTGTSTPTPTPTPTPPPPPTGTGVTVNLAGGTVITTNPQWGGGEQNNRGETNGDNLATVAQTLVNHGVHGNEVLMGYAPNVGTGATESGYRAAMNASHCTDGTPCTCNSGSQCDPNSSFFNWSTYDSDVGADVANSKNFTADGAGQFISLEFTGGYTFAFAEGNPAHDGYGTCDSGSGTSHNASCFPNDWGVFEDLMMKEYQHFLTYGLTPSEVQSSQEPNTCNHNFMCIVNSDAFVTYYYHFAHAIKQVAPNEPVGGPGVDNSGGAGQWLGWMKNSTGYDGSRVPDNFVNFITWHDYSADNTFNFISQARQFYPTAGMPGGPGLAVGEWNLGGTTTQNGNSDLGFYGRRILNFIGVGAEGDLFRWQHDCSDVYQGFVCPGYTLYQKVWVNYLFWHDIGVRGGDSVKPSSTSGIDVGYGGYTSTGHPWAGINTWNTSVPSGCSGWPCNVTATFQGLIPNHTYSASVYLADNIGNGSDNQSAQGTWASGSVTSDGSGNGNFTWSQPQSGVSGILLQ